MYRRIAIASIAAITLALGASNAASAAGGRGNDRCVHNYYSDNPCLSSVASWRAWAAEQGIAADRRSAEIFQAYAERDVTTGDRLLAELKGTTVDQVSAAR
jgi:hypothetical protein